MEYSALAIGLTDELFFSLQSLTSHNLRFTPSLTVQDASRLLIQQVFHLLIVDLKYLRSIQQMNWAELYDKCTFEAKKMIAAQFVKAVHIKRDYEMSRSCTAWSKHCRSMA